MGAYPKLDNKLDISPVDFVAGAIAKLATSAVTEGRTFHLTNPTFVQWVFREISPNFSRVVDVELVQIFRFFRCCGRVWIWSERVTLFWMEIYVDWGNFCSFFTFFQFFACKISKYFRFVRFVDLFLKNSENFYSCLRKMKMHCKLSVPSSRMLTRPNPRTLLYNAPTPKLLFNLQVIFHRNFVEISIYHNHLQPNLCWNSSA